MTKATRSTIRGAVLVVVAAAMSACDTTAGLESIEDAAAHFWHWLCKKIHEL